MMKHTSHAKRNTSVQNILGRLRTAFNVITLFFQELRRRVYSNRVYQVLRRDLSVDVVASEPLIPLFLKKLRPQDIPGFIDVCKPDLSKEEVWERIRIRNMINSGIQTPYVVVTDNDDPCHIAWLIDSRENEKVKSFFKKRIPPLNADEVLFELVFTLKEYRGLGIQPWRIRKFIDISLHCGARWAWVYIKSTNAVSLKNVAINAFEPYMIRTDKWRFFRCQSEFRLLQEDRGAD